MRLLLAFSRFIDAVNETVGRAVAWLVLLAVLIAAGNAIVRKALNMASNGLLELQWYLFGAVFMLGAAWTMKSDEHVRVDVLSSRLDQRVRDRIEVFGLLFFFFPFALLHIFYAVPFVAESWRTQEWSTSPGGLIIWPAKLVILVGFVLLALQGVSQIIKRIAILSGALPNAQPASQHEPPPVSSTPGPMT